MSTHLSTATIVTLATNELLATLGDDGAIAFYADDPEDGALVLVHDGRIIQVTPTGDYTSATLPDIPWVDGPDGNASSTDDDFDWSPSAEEGNAPDLNNSRYL